MQSGASCCTAQFRWRPCRWSRQSQVSNRYNVFILSWYLNSREPSTSPSISCPLGSPSLSNTPTEPTSSPGQSTSTLEPIKQPDNNLHPSVSLALNSEPEEEHSHRLVSPGVTAMSKKAAFNPPYMKDQ